MAGELARVVSDHVPVNDGTYVWPKNCCACGLEWPCQTFQRQLQGQTDNRADRMRAHMTVWSLRMLSRPELSFIGPSVSAQLLDWIDGAVAAQDAIDRARKVVQGRAQSAASRFAGHAKTAAGRFMPLGGGRQLVEEPPPSGAQPLLVDLDDIFTPNSRSTGEVRRARGGGWNRVGRWRFGRGHHSN